MAEIVVTFPDGSSAPVEAGVTVAEALRAHRPEAIEDGLAAKANGSLVDLSRPLEASASLSVVTFDDPEGAELYRHSTSHILAQAVKRLWPDARDGLAKFLAKRGEGIHHIAFDVDDVAAALSHYKAKGVRLINEQPEPGANDTLVAFLHPKSTGGVLLELCQPAPPAGG